MPQIKWLDPANIWRIQLHKEVRQRPGDSLTGPPLLADPQRCHQEGLCRQQSPLKKSRRPTNIYLGTPYYNFHRLRLLGQMTSEINGINWLASDCANVVWWIVLEIKIFLDFWIFVIIFTVFFSHKAIFFSFFGTNKFSLVNWNTHTKWAASADCLFVYMPLDIDKQKYPIFSRQ